MRYLKLSWHYIVVEPFHWMFLCFFQPTRFKKDYENENIVSRIVFTTRMALPTFLICFPFAVLVRAVFYLIYPGNTHFLLGNFFLNTANYAALGIVLGSVLGIALGSAWGIAGNIAGGSAWGIALATIFEIGNSGRIEIPVIAFSSITGVIVGSIAGIIVGRRGLGIGVGAVLGIAGGFAGGIMGGFVGGIQLGVVSGISLGVLGGIVGGIGKGIVANVRKGFLGNIIAHIPENMEVGIRKNVVTGVAAGLQIGMQIGIIGGIILGIVGVILRFKYNFYLNLFNNPNIVNQVVGLGIIWGIIWGITLGSALGRVWSLAGGIALGIAGGVALGLSLLIAGGMAAIILIAGGGLALSSPRLSLIEAGIEGGIIGCIAFILSYVLGYYRLPFYPVSAFSVLKAYAVSKKNPLQVFNRLQASSLYWDECIFLPLPRLKHMLLIAANQDMEQTLESLRFILTKRPQHIYAAQEVSLEMAIGNLEACVSLQDIAEVSHMLIFILPQETTLMNPRWSKLFARLNDISREATSYCTPIGWQARYDALLEMRKILKNAHSNPALKDTAINERLGRVINTWRTLAQHGLEELERAPEKTDHVSNPYAPGPILGRRDSRFVGRHDLVQKLGDALSRGNSHPTFLLYGERRMGKSSTLKQLPDLLGAHYLPITFDLQHPGLTSSAAAFLSTIAEEMGNTIHTRGMQVKRLSYDELLEAGRENEAAVYFSFDKWLKKVEHTLAKENKMLLLAFDEFAELEESAKAGYINMIFLLKWFRNIIQNSSHIAFLFSGTQTFSEMGWAGYFVNVQVLKVSFLHPSEARQLITRPVPNFPGEQIFSEGVVEKIMCMTGCHPFLVQAICSPLIDIINENKCDHVELKDVTKAMHKVLETWGPTYFRDLWERTDEIQQCCLFALKNLGKADVHSIEQQSGLDAITLRRTLKTLIERDLVLLEDNTFRIATPIFAEWVEQNG